MYLGQGIADLQLKSTIGTVKKRAKKNLLLKIGWANNRKLLKQYLPYFNQRLTEAAQALQF